MHYIIISNSQAHEEKKKKGRQEKERRKETNKMMEPGGIKSKDFKNKEFVWYTIYHSLSIQKKCKHRISLISYVSRNVIMQFLSFDN